MGWVVVFPDDTFSFPGLCHTHSLMETSSECWDREAPGFAGQECDVAGRRLSLGAGWVQCRQMMLAWGTLVGLPVATFTGTAQLLPALQPLAGHPRASLCEDVPCLSFSLPPNLLQCSLVVSFPGRWAALLGFNPLPPKPALWRNLLTSFGILLSGDYRDHKGP